MVGSRLGEPVEEEVPLLQGCEVAVDPGQEFEVDVPLHRESPDRDGPTVHEVRPVPEFSTLRSGEPTYPGRSPVYVGSTSSTGGDCGGRRLFLVRLPGHGAPFLLPPALSDPVSVPGRRRCTSVL